MFQDSGLMLSDFPSYYLKIPNLHRSRLHLTDDRYQESRLVKFDKSSIIYPSKTLKLSTFFGETNKGGFFIKEDFQKLRFVKKVLQVGKNIGRDLLIWSRK
jgi:hypothetical protein